MDCSTIHERVSRVPCGNQNNEDSTPSVDLLQMTIPPPPPAATDPPMRPNHQRPAEPETLDSAPGRSSTTGRLCLPPPPPTGVSGCYATCRACAEERYVRQQRSRRDDPRAVAPPSGTPCARCPPRSKPVSIDATGSGGSGPVYLNYIRFPDGAATTTKTVKNRSAIGACDAAGNDTWSSFGRSRQWPSQMTSSGDATGSFPRFGGTGLVAGCPVSVERDVDDKEETYHEYDAFDFKRTDASAKYSRRSRLNQSGFTERLLDLTSSLCGREVYRRCCRKASATSSADRKHHAMVLVPGGAPDEQLDPVTTSLDDESTRWNCQSQEEPEVAAKDGHRDRSGKTSRSPEGRSRQRRYVVLCAGILAGLFITTCSLLTAFVVLRSTSALPGDRRHIDDSHNTGVLQHNVNSVVPAASGSSILTSQTHNLTQKIDYITVVPSLTKAIPDTSGWAMFAGGSEKGSRYTLIDKVTTFYGGQERCQKLGGYLVHINSLREQLFIEDFISQDLNQRHEVQTVTRHPGTDEGVVGYWLGAKRARGSHDGTCMYDQWKWIDSYGRTLSTISGLTAFMPGKPDNYYNPEECLFLSLKDRTDESRFLKWDDAPCDLNSVGGIKVLCEVELR